MTTVDGAVAADEGRGFVWVTVAVAMPAAGGRSTVVARATAPVVVVAVAGRMILEAEDGPL